jgi:hypothetical protein
LFEGACPELVEGAWSELAEEACPEPAEGDEGVRRPMSWSVQMWGCVSDAIVRASLSKRCFISGSSTQCGGSTLMATVRFSRVSDAL